MTLQQIIDFVNFVIRKSQAGETMTPEQYNVLLSGFNIQLFQDELQRVEVVAKAQGIPVYKAFHTSSALLRFIVHQMLPLTSGGNVALPSGYVHYIGLIALYNGALRDIDVITEEAMNNRRSSMLDTQLTIKPAAVIDSSIRVFPKNVGSTVGGEIEFSYLRMPNTPVYDYCFDESTGSYIYMPVGSYINSLNNMYLSGVTSVYASNVFHPNHVQYTTYTSVTVELDWYPRFHMRFVQALLQAVAPSLNPELLNQYVKEMPK